MTATSDLETILADPPGRFSVSAVALKNPYPGLRSFTHEDTHVFFGREGQSDALIAKLSSVRFLAVVGTSGSGKSSLIRAGLLPSLWAGYLQSAGAEWFVADFSPGSNPVSRLTDALNASGFFASELHAEELTGNPRSLRQLIEHAAAPRRNLLIIVDQFEELFRFTSSDRSPAELRDEQAVFVKALLDVSRGRDLPVYVVMTMRSDFVGDCARFRDLPEAVTSGQYLIPRTTREERRSIIEGPARVAGSAVANRLVQQLLNDVGDDPDQLPVLQHALMRTWQHWRQAGDDRPIDIEDYQAIGTLSDALSRHADEAWLQAGREVPNGSAIVQRIFQRLRDRDSIGREVRVPTSRGALAQVAAASEEAVDSCVAEFLAPGRSFLRVSKAGEVDVTHECLLRQWKTLAHDWVNEELESRRTYLRLVDRSEDAQPMVDPVLQFTLDWWDKRKPNQAWANRYDVRWEQAQAFLHRSEREREQRRRADESAANSLERAVRAKTLRRSLAGLAALAIAVCAAAYIREHRNLQKITAQRAQLAAQSEALDQARADAVTQLLASRASAKGADKSAAGVAALLAATSYKRKPTVDTQIVLSAALSTLPLAVRRIQTGLDTPNIEFDGRGKRLAAAGSGKLQIWDVAGRVRSQEWTVGGGRVSALRWASAGGQLALLTADSAIIVDPAARPQEPFSVPCVYPQSLSIDDSGDSFVASCNDKGHFFVRTADKSGRTKYKEQPQRFDTRGVGWTISSHADEASYVERRGTEDGYVYHVRGLTGDSSSAKVKLPGLQMWDTGRDDLSIVAWLGDGPTVYSTTVGDDTTVEKKYFDAVNRVANYALSKAGDKLVALTIDGVVQLWDRQSMREILRTQLDWHQDKGRAADSPFVAIDTSGQIAASDTVGDVFVVTPPAAQSLRLVHPTLASSGGAFVASRVGEGLVTVAVNPDGVTVDRLIPPSAPQPTKGFFSVPVTGRRDFG